MPGWPASAERALKPAPKGGPALKGLGTADHAYASWLNYKIDKSDMPSHSEVQARQVQSLNVKQKFRTLQDLREDSFHDLVVQVVREPYDLGDRMTLWVSDYTANSLFYNFAMQDGDCPGARDGDPYGYTNGFAVGPAPRQWAGPLGRHSMQISVWEPHAEFIRCNVKASSWVRLMNVRIKYGSNSSNLEGFLRQDRGAPNKIRVEVLDTNDAPQNVDDKLKQALRRKKDLEGQKKKQLKAYKAEKKRKATDEGDSGKQELNSKSRRKAKRAAAIKKVEEKEGQQMQMLGLNSQSMPAS